MNRSPRTVPIEALDDFPERIDVRSPAEFAEDHLPHATSHPVLNDEERAHVGTLYTQTSPFAARVVGAGLVARNIARMIEEAFHTKPREWSPLVYCWRGGQRSAALTHVLAQIGWRPAQLEGGYKSYRRWVMQALAQFPARYRFIAICGLTGTGKSRLLKALAAAGEQVLDLEVLAAHRGSLLGNLPARPQPSQKKFDTDLLEVLRHFDPEKPVYVESESVRIGRLRLPDALAQCMWQSACLRVELPVAQRVALLKAEYPHFLDDVDALSALLDKLTPLHGRKRIENWQALARAGAWEEFVAALLLEHYDPAYLKSMRGHYAAFENAPRITARDESEAAFSALAEEIAAGLGSRAVRALSSAENTSKM